MICVTCTNDLPITKFRPRSKFGNDGGLCNRARSKVCRGCEYEDWKRKGRCPVCKNIVVGVCQRCAEKRRHKLANDKLVVIANYGNECRWCGEANQSYLTIDHKNNDGANAVKSRGGRRWRAIINAGFPTDLRLLCRNCNSGRAIYGDDAVLAALAGYEYHGELTLNKARRIKEKQTILDHYGQECLICHESAFVFLTIDHIDGGGHQHRKAVGNNIYRWLITNDFPINYRVLCWNCNYASFAYGENMLVI